MGSPLPLLVIFTLYFTFLNLGPRVMKVRKPFNLATVIRVYNIFQVASCIAFAYTAYKFKYNVIESTWRCLKFEDHLDTFGSMRSIFTFYWYFMILRTVELIETIFFILRKKQQQVSFLHVYHHVSTIGFLYILNRYSASKWSWLILTNL